MGQGVEKRIRIALAQINCTVGDLPGNCAKIKEYTEKARDRGADIVCFPELAITGYPPEDLLLKHSFISDNIDALKKLSAEISGIVSIIGFVDHDSRGIYNAAAVVSDGAIRGIQRKKHLPNYEVFDEKRYFTPGMKSPVFEMDGVVFGVNICEDIWHARGPIRGQVAEGARLICNINASPYHMGKVAIRQDVLVRQAKRTNVTISYTNLVGGQDELVFDGHSFLVDAQGCLIARASAFQEEMMMVDLDVPLSKPASPENSVVLTRPDTGVRKDRAVARIATELTTGGEIYQALLLGLRDYVIKNGFGKVVLGLSGGVDSALVAVLAADALGKENVTAVFMPSRYSSKESGEDATALASILGIRFLQISIDDAYGIYLSMLESEFYGKEHNITEENLQARIRGNILMALSNKFGCLVLTTGNKSEMSVGYATLYGDMAGGFAVIKDVPKTLVYEVCRYRNSLGNVIPERILIKAPTAELRPDQKDTDSLPPYEELDPVLKAYVEEDKDIDSIIAMGYEPDMVRKIIRMVDLSEYKRRQSPPGVRITPKAFGKDRRMPITNKYKG
jgi:NAD+ synthase (glutamine-hydrolysing)